MWKPPLIEWERKISTTVQDVLIPKSPCDYIISGFQVLDRNFLIFFKRLMTSHPPPKKNLRTSLESCEKMTKMKLSFKTSDLDTCTCVTKSYFKNIPKIFAKITISTTECIFCVIKPSFSRPDRFYTSCLPFTILSDCLIDKRNRFLFWSVTFL